MLTIFCACAGNPITYSNLGFLTETQIGGEDEKIDKKVGFFVLSSRERSTFGVSRKDALRDEPCIEAKACTAGLR